MNRLMLMVAVIGGAFLVTVCKGPENRPPDEWDTIKKKEKNESATLNIGLQESRCELTEIPEQIRARPGKRVTFVVEGSCNQADQITIGRFQPNAEPFEAVAAVSAQDGQVLNVKLKPQPSKDFGLWHYDVLLNGKPIGAAGQGTQSGLGSFFEPTLRAAGSYGFAICPSWPCTRG